MREVITTKAHINMLGGHWSAKKSILSDKYTYGVGYRWPCIDDTIQRCLASVTF